MTRFVKSPKDVASGLLLILLAAFFAWQALDLPMGRAIRMGPGYFPMILAGLLGFLGLLVLIGGLTVPAAEEDAGIGFRRWPWQALGLVTLAVVVFGLGIRPLGLGPSMGLAVFLSALASRRFNIVTGLASAAIMVAFSWAVFIKGLGLPLPLLGPLLGGY
ncbi:tripartite tricarboxylate transporter TctB family protein [Starkeya koreensis]|uniref:Tripartite tricarboxylate transporter TctB family protein n=1 Tax=Ancylobacter koreensis TaxID=266121 RepID=A0ABT0DPG6_9HYPH|nr:tripartite tricarboxylate transporter TctB family protein [Ancylobacter koreensis]MCK0209176.1 tripartite tricarboxylate transporter TctB family protein [Ancylobacter koreensis]